MNFHFQQFIGGEWTDAKNGGTWDVINPGTEEIVRTVPFGDRADAETAIAAAYAAFPAWSRMTPWERGDILMRAAAMIRENLEEIWPVNSAESGKTIADAKGDLLAAAALFDWFAEEGKRAEGRTMPARKPGRRHMTIKQPIGVVGTITAWNFPAYNTSRAWAAALAAGCTVVGRPSEYTPLTAMILTEFLERAGIPKGVMNLINGEPASMGQAMLEVPECRKVHFTGSTRVGRLLMDGASKTMTRLSLECGGNAPVLVFPDADMEAIGAQVAQAACRNTGQVCISPQRFLVHGSRQQEFAERSAEAMASLKVGVGADPETQIGPLINAQQRDKVESIVDRTVGQGAKLLTGGRRPEQLAKGYFYTPTVLSGVTPDQPSFSEEIFGPVLPITPFDSVDEVIQLANTTEYGLAAYVWTRDLNTAVRCYEGLEFGMIAVNDWTAGTIEGPFPGWKQSGQGMECGREGLEEYLETKLVGFGGIE